MTAAEKMDNLAAPCTRVGEGGRVVWNRTPKRSAKSKVKRMRHTLVTKWRRGVGKYLDHPEKDPRGLKNYNYSLWLDPPALYPRDMVL